MRFLHNKGLTLTELLVASILLGIVMLGIVGMNASLSRTESISSKSILLTIRAIPILKDFRKNAALAIGDSTPQGQGIQFQFTATDQLSWISFRQDINNTPSDYSDDIWVIYISDPVKHTLRSCKQLESDDGFTPNELGECSDAKSTIWADNIVSGEFSFDPDPTAFKFYVNAKITTLFDPTKDEHPQNNPKYNLEVSISPMQHSW